MNKLIGIFVVLVCLLAGCASSTLPTATVSPTTTDASTTAPTIPTTVPTEPTTSSADEAVLPLTDAQRKQIRQDFSVHENHDFTGGEDKDPRYVCGMPYYGTYNGYIILYDKGQAAVISQTKIGKHIFMHATGGCQLYAYRDGQFNQLKDVYESGAIGDEDLATIAKIHRTFDRRG